MFWSEGFAPFPQRRFFSHLWSFLWPKIWEQIPQTSFTLSATQGNFFPLESENPLDLNEILLEIDEIITESQEGTLKIIPALEVMDPTKSENHKFGHGLPHSSAQKIKIQADHLGVYETNWYKWRKKLHRDNFCSILAKFFTSGTPQGENLLHLFTKFHSTKTSALGGTLERIPRFWS